MTGGEATSVSTGPDGARRIAVSLRTPSDLRPRHPLGDGVRAARAFAFDVALPRTARATGRPLQLRSLPDGVLPSGRGVAAEQPAMPTTGALAAYAALLASKVKPPRDVPVRGLPLVVRRPAHSAESRLPGSTLGALVPEDVKVTPNAARAPRRSQGAGAPQPRPASSGAASAAQRSPVVPAAQRGTPARGGAARVVPSPTPRGSRTPAR